MHTDIRIPKNGWLLVSRVTGEHQIIDPSLDSLSIAWTAMRDSARRMGSDKAELVRCYELGSQMTVTTKTTIEKLVPLDEETVQLVDKERSV
jgi:hypothetical protein